MLVSSIVKKFENCNSSAQPILINTSSLNREKLRDCIDNLKEIERQDQLKQSNKLHRCLNNSTLLEATMTHKQGFKYSFENDRFLTALEDDDIFGPRLLTDLDASHSIEKAMQYFDESVNADSGPSRDVTPTKLPCTGTVATAIAELKRQVSPPPPYQNCVSPKSYCEKTKPQVPKGITKELREKYEQYVLEKQKPQTHKWESPNLPSKTMVKQLAEMFNSKISQLMGQDSSAKKDSKSSIAKPSQKPAMVKPQQDKELYTSKLTVALKPSPEQGGCLPKQRIPPRALPRKIREQRFLSDMKMMRCSRKRSNNIVDSLCFDTYGPPKKIHRTYSERFQPYANFRDSLMKRMFKNWMMEKLGVPFDITTFEHTWDSIRNADEASTSKSSDTYKSEKTVVKLESVETRVMRQDSTGGKNIDNGLEQEDANKNLIEVDLPIRQAGTPIYENISVQRKVKCQASQQDTNEGVAMDLPNNTTGSSDPATEQVEPQASQSLTVVPTTDKPQSQYQDLSPVASANKNYEVDNELASSSSSKIKNDVLQTKQTESPGNKTLDPEFNKLNNQFPKKKLHRSLNWDTDNSVIDNYVSSSTESDEIINAKTNQDTKYFPIENQNTYIGINAFANSAQKAFELEKQKEKMLETTLSSINSPEMIGGGYKLTALSTPSPYTGSPSPPAESNPEMVGKGGICQKSLSPPSNVITPPESFIDLGFETGSYDRESPNRTSPPFVKLTPELDNSRQQTYMGFSSTPAQEWQNQLSQMKFSSSAARLIQQQSISPMGADNAGRRCLWSPNGLRQGSPPMQVICEDRPLELVEPSKTSNSPIIAESSFHGTTFNLNMTNKTEHQDKSSKFWVCAEDITISLEVFYHTPDRLCLLREIFNENNCASCDLNFGIDVHKFFRSNSIEETNILARLSTAEGWSRYWFSTGEAVVQFNGKFFSSEKVRRLFNFIKDSMTDNTQLRFGVDDYEFSMLPENKENSNRCSMRMTACADELCKKVKELKSDLKYVEKRVKIFSNDSGNASGIIPHSEESALSTEKEKKNKTN